MRKLSIALLMIFIICILNTVNVFAANATAGLSVDKTTVKPGDTVIVTLNATCYEGLSAIVTGIQYDKDVLTLQSSTIADKWVNYGVDKYEILSNSSEKFTSLNALTLTFTVNQDAKDGITQISTTSIEVTDINNKDYTLGKSEKTITIENVKDNPVEDEPSQDEPVQDTPTQDEEDNSPSNNTNNQGQDDPAGSENTNNKPDNTITQTKLPNTGYRNLIIMGIVIAIVTTIAYIQIKRNSFK